MNLSLLGEAGAASETLIAGFAVRGGVYRSTDDGANWQQCIDNYASTSTPHLVPSKRDSRVLYAGIGPIRISPADAGTILFTGFTTLMKSTDGAATMRTVLDDTAYLGTRQFMDIKFAPSDPRVIWAAAKGYILYKSTDGGERFTRVTAVREMIYGPEMESRCARCGRGRLRSPSLRWAD